MVLRFIPASVRAPGDSEISKRLYRQTSQDVCPWNVKFSRDATEVAFVARDVIAGKDPATLAAEVLAMSQEEFNAVFRKSPMKRAKLAGLQRNARVVLAGARSADRV
jgi:epoxyqueuosine reductase QueG